MMTGYRWTALAGAFVLAGALIAACDTPAGPQDLAVELRLAPDALAAGDTLRARLTIRNPTSDAVTLASPDGCVAEPMVHGSDGPLPWVGTGALCLAAVTRRTVEAGGELVGHYRLPALIRPGPFSAEELSPEPGTYRLRLVMHVGLPDVEAEFRVISDR